MKIHRIKYSNFRNFEKEGTIEFDTDGKVTIVYGTNGDGKTTLHQLFQWILYGKVKFNNTTTANKLYNLKKGRDLNPDRSMFVKGTIDFEHEGIQYQVTREYEYYKNASGEIRHRAERDDFIVQKCERNNWDELEEPEKFIEEILPSGLSPYFFFDGETMIADLKVRGTESAKNLKHALNTLFELEVYEKALVDIGDTKKTQSALGLLEGERLKQLANKKKGQSPQNGGSYVRDIRILTEKIESAELRNTSLMNRLNEYKKRLIEISEEIGNNKSKKSLERDRKTHKSTVDMLNKKIQDKMKEFGKNIEENFSYLLINEVVKDAEKRIYLQVQDEEKNVIRGLSKELLKALLNNENNSKCICGNPLCEKEIEELLRLKSYFPPTSYKATYSKFVNSARKYSGKYTDDILSKSFMDILEIKENIKAIEIRISEIDEELSGASNVDELIEERKEKEGLITQIEKEIEANKNDISTWNYKITVRKNALNKSDEASKEESLIKRQIDYLIEIKDSINMHLINETKQYSENLRDEIQELIDMMLTSERTVVLNEDFLLQVKDSYGDESKSEGQFAVVSFAYIIGILKVLKMHERLRDKEYPLILDGPFSKLDIWQRQNVIDTIPQYAPQVIIFSKDSLEEYIDQEKVGYVWKIVSNNEKNNAVIERGNLEWN